VAFCGLFQDGNGGGEGLDGLLHLLFGVLVVLLLLVPHGSSRLNVGSDLLHFLRQIGPLRGKLDTASIEVGDVGGELLDAAARGCVGLRLLARDALGPADEGFVEGLLGLGLLFDLGADAVQKLHDASDGAQREARGRGEAGEDEGCC